MNLKALLAGFGIGLIACGGASAAIPADVIRSFNTSLEGNDPSAVIQTAEALIASAVENPDDPGARGAAFEAGTQLCLRNACERALAAAPLMTGPGTEDVSAVLANLLVVYATWTVEQTKANDKALMAALEAVAPETPTYLTISAFDRFHMAKLAAEDLKDLRKVAELAAGHLKPVWNMVPANWASMELSAIATTFARDQEIDVIDRLAKLEVTLYPYYIAARKERPELTNLYYQAYAWRYAVEAFFNSRTMRPPPEVKAAEAYVSAETAKIWEAYSKDREPNTPICKGGLKSAPTPTYPAGAIQDGYVGAVILGFFIDEGEIVDVHVLAAVPDRQFEEASIRAMSKVKWYFDEVQDNPDCKRSRSSRPAIQSFLFMRR